MINLFKLINTYFILLFFQDLEASQGRKFVANSRPFVLLEFSGACFIVMRRMISIQNRLGPASSLRSPRWRMRLFVHFHPSSLSLWSRFIKKPSALNIARFGRGRDWDLAMPIAMRLIVDEDAHPNSQHDLGQEIDL